LSRKNGRSHVDERPPILAENAVLNDAQGQEMAPTLYSLLKPTFRDGKCCRLGATLRLKVNGSHYVVTVSCETEELQATLVLDSLVDLVPAVELLCASPKTAWLEMYAATKRARQESRR
jgi:hypothetical protein